MWMAVSGRHSAEICKRPPPLLFGGRLQISAVCPPSTLIGWGQVFDPPPHYLSATTLMRGKHIFPAPPICLPSGYPIARLTSIVACGGLRPPHPRSCGSCVPLRAVLRPRRYRLRNVSPALSRLVTCHPPYPHPLSPFPSRTPREGTTIGWDIFFRLPQRTAGLVCVLAPLYRGGCGSSRAPRMVLPGYYGYRGVYLVIITILVGSVIARLWRFFGCRIENRRTYYDK